MKVKNVLIPRQNFHLYFNNMKKNTSEQMYSVTIVPECVKDINQSLMIPRNNFKVKNECEIF